MFLPFPRWIATTEYPTRCFTIYFASLGVLLPDRKRNDQETVRTIHHPHHCRRQPPDWYLLFPLFLPRSNTIRRPSLHFQSFCSSSSWFVTAGDEAIGPRRSSPEVGCPSPAHDFYVATIGATQLTTSVLASPSRSEIDRNHEGCRRSTPAHPHDFSATSEFPIDCLHVFRSW